MYPDDEIVCYDNLGIFSSARAAWMFRYFGASNVKVLNGGFKKWKLDGLPTVLNAEQQQFKPRTSSAKYEVKTQTLAITDINEVYKIAQSIFNNSSDY